MDQPREILRAFVKDFVEMTPTGRENYCCGGGGGTVSVDELHEYRMKVAGKVKADQIRDTGAQIVATPCANCKKQLRELMDYYDLPVENRRGTRPYPPGDSPAWGFWNRE